MSSMAGHVEQLKASQGMEAAQVLHSVTCYTAPALGCSWVQLGAPGARASLSGQVPFVAPPPPASIVTNAVKHCPHQSC